MRLASGKRIGQSGPELFLAASFSFFIHIIVFVGAIFLYVQSAPKAIVPPFYKVTLVAPAPDMPQPTQQEPLPAPQPPPEPQIQKLKEKKPALKKGAMPELKRPKPEREYVAEDAPEKPAKPAKAPAEKQETVAIKPPSEMDQRFAWYTESVRRKIEDNWKHLPVPKDTKVRVIFKILRSGWLEEVKLEEESGIYDFNKAAIRAIRSSSPFPSLPEDFSKPYVIFSVDLMPE